MNRTLLLGGAVLLLASAAGPAEKYSGPWPPKPDVPFLVHADNLIETEVMEATDEDRGRDILNWVAGENSPVRTPLAEPIFLFEAQKLNPELLGLYKFDVRKGRREIVVPKKESKDTPRRFRLTFSRLEGKLYRIEANEILENGEYSLSPDGSPLAFCFQVY